MSVTNSKTAYETSAGDGAVNDGNDIGQLCFKSRVEVGGSANSDETVRISETSEDADLGRVFELTTDSHDCRYGWSRSGSVEESSQRGEITWERKEKRSEGCCRCGAVCSYFCLLEVGSRRNRKPVLICLMMKTKERLNKMI